jgi:O-antigen/teichoic acid export membrane protein
MLTVLAKLGSPEHVGQFALGSAIVAPVIVLSNLQLRAIQATDAREEYQFSDYLGLRLLTSMLAILVIVGIAFFAGFRWETALVILAFSVSKTVESISDVYYGLMQHNERMDIIARSMMGRGVLALAALAVGFALTRSVFWGVVAMAGAWAAVLTLHDIRNGAQLLHSGTASVFPRWEWRTLLRLAWLALPLGVVMMLISLNTNIPRYFVERYLGEHELGIFAAMAYLMVVGTTVVRALGQSASPRLAKYYAAGNVQAFRGLLLKLVGIGAVLGAGGVLVALVAGREILTLLYGPEYARVDVFVWVMVAAGIWYASSLGVAMTAARYIKIQIPLITFVALSTALACWSLIPSVGLLGGAMALVIGASVRAVSIALIIWHVLGKLSNSNVKSALKR